MVPFSVEILVRGKLDRGLRSGSKARSGRRRSGTGHLGDRFSGFGASGLELKGDNAHDQHNCPQNGEPTPSPILLTMLHKKPGVAKDEYIQRWHGGHTPLSLEVHPLWYYQRNVIREPVTEGAAPSDGIVLEACRTRADLLNPASFFGGALRMVPNILRISKDISGFLDMKKTETFYATEYHLRS